MGRGVEQVVRRRGIITVATLAAVLLGVVSWWIAATITANSRNEIGESLSTVLETTQQAVRSWVKEHRAAAQIWADSPEVRRLTKELLSGQHTEAALRKASAQNEIRAWLRPVQAGTNYLGFFIIGPDNMNLGSSRDKNLGSPNLLVKQEDFLATIRSGETAMSLPQPSDVPLPDENGILRERQPTMFVGAHIRDESGAIIAVLTFRINPGEDFTDIFQRGRLGTSGETYAFDKRGLLISESRFDDQLREIGLIEPDELGILNVAIRDPGVDLVKGESSNMPESQRPLTRMAESAVAGSSGIDLDGYRDYRGVPVIGAWLWDADLGLGITTEIDVDEGYETLRSIQYALSALTVFSILLLVGLTTIFIASRKRLLASEARKTAFLESALRAEEALQETNERYRIALRSTGITLFTQDRNLRFTWAYNPFPDFDANAILGKTDEDLLGPEHGARLMETKQRVLETGQGTREEHSTSIAGKTIHYDLTVEPLRDVNDEIAGIICASIDITERKEAEKELEKHRDHLEELVEERTAQLEAANKELEAFSYSVSHDLRAPLRAIDGFGAALLEDYGEQLDEEGRRLIGIMRENATQMGQLIDDLLTFSRLGRQEMKAAHINMTALAKGVFEDLRAAAPDKMEMTISKLPSANGDRSLLHHVFLNLIDNAIKYSRLEQAPVVEIDGHTEDGEHIYSVRDNGVGFDMKYADKLFAVFQRLHRADEFEGTGVGLALVQRIVARHGGRIWAEAEVDHGATFHFTLPTKEAQ